MLFRCNNILLFLYLICFNFILDNLRELGWCVVWDVNMFICLLLFKCGGWMVVCYLCLGIWWNWKISYKWLNCLILCMVLGIL